ncbi:MAG: hypothetical protein SVO01_00035 [Thermotogota bacterium]|nr:hypothetical protein [Thermotogota bacterium]
MREINIGTKKNTTVIAIDEIEFNANHLYHIVDSNIPVDTFAEIEFQKGPIKDYGINGCHNEDLIIIIIDRLQSFQKSDFACRENALTITKLEEALHWLNHRTSERKRRGVEGTNQL